MLRALSKTFALSLAILGLGLFTNPQISLAQADPAPASTGIGDGCGESTNSRMNNAERRTIANLVTPEVPASAFSCRDVSSIPEAQRQASCVSGLCPGAATVMCCKPSIGASLNVTGGSDASSTGPSTTGQTGGVGRLALPSCVSDGNCGLDGMVTMAVNFSNFLFGISGAIFLLIFVYAGFRLIFFAPDAGTVKEAKSMLVKATTGMVIIALAGVATTYLYNGLRSGQVTGGGAPTTSSACATREDGQPSGLTCVQISNVPRTTDYAAYSAALESMGCRPSPRGQSLCTGATNYCCPAGTPDTYVAR
ncbi:MAG: hypothetical protein KC582_02505 [Candidatus Magasanikbacteria bacterium]|nr:hypothetical protein [Candidatus Magasanikbacteria bacterium]MCA9389610.1 hypothetical protein [Candidatus Magasanikbacteria bacterium]MCA9391101.1 hypothetical protein [Candidatus Magasanikbacteria bacterium]USN52416.1 MAG: hypothetical protein H6759_05405 [Candidatus Nomurabacteria bacterium]HPF95010.1 pilin [bacterium]